MLHLILQKILPFLPYRPLLIIPVHFVHVYTFLYTCFCCLFGGLTLTDSFFTQSPPRICETPTLQFLQIALQFKKTLQQFSTGPFLTCLLFSFPLMLFSEFSFTSLVQIAVTYNKFSCVYNSLPRSPLSLGTLGYYWSIYLISTL